jgi:hypothetical protein
MSDQYSGVYKTNRGGFILNCLTIIVLLAALGVAGVTAAVFLNPYMSYNPYPPPTLPPTLGPPTATPTPEIFLPSTWTPTPSDTPTPSPAPTDTPAPPTETPVPTDTTPEATPTGPPFSLQSGSPVLTPNIANDLACDWMGVGGQVFNVDGEPIQGLGVHLEGTIGELPIKLDSLTGSATALGPAGYVFNVSDHPIASVGTLWIQLNDTAGIPLSDKVVLDTSDSCDQNLVLINWKQVR